MTASPWSSPYRRTPRARFAGKSESIESVAKMDACEWKDEVTYVKLEQGQLLGHGPRREIEESRDSLVLVGRLALEHRDFREQMRRG